MDDEPMISSTANAQGQQRNDKPAPTVVLMPMRKHRRIDRLECTGGYPEHGRSLLSSPLSPKLSPLPWCLRRIAARIGVKPGPTPDACTDADVTPGVVNIAVRARSPATENPLLKDPFSAGSSNCRTRRRNREKPPQQAPGVVVDARQGYVLTNNVEADRIEITTKDPASPRPACRTRPWNGCRRTPGSGSGSSGGAVRRQ